MKNLKLNKLSENKLKNKQLQNTKGGGVQGEPGKSPCACMAYDHNSLVNVHHSSYDEILSPR